MSSGIPVDTKHARRRRLRATVKVRARRVETALDRARSRAAQALAPDPDGALARRAAVQDAEREVRRLDAEGRVFTRRDTGAQVRTRDTQAAKDEALHTGIPTGTPGIPGLSSSPGLAAVAALTGLPDGPDRYEVECLTHRGDPLFFDDAGAAARAARRSDVWCEGCRRLEQALHPARIPSLHPVLLRSMRGWAWKDIGRRP